MNIKHFLTSQLSLNDLSTRSLTKLFTSIVSAALGDHWGHRRGVYRGAPLHQQDQIRGEVYGETMSLPGQPSARVSAQDGGDGQRAVLVSPPRFTGRTSNYEKIQRSRL